MRILRNKTNTAAITLVLVLTIAVAFGAVAISVPTVDAQVSISLSLMLEPIIGVDSPTLISWRPSPNLLLTDPLYADQTYVWPGATVTFTRPDASTDVVSGPFKTRFPVPGDPNRRDIILVYAPDMMGTWTVNFTWPGDGTYAPVTREDTFPVGEHFPKRNTYAHLSLRPYPAIGIGQSLLVNAWITPPPMTERDNFENYTFTIRKPDGTIAYTFNMDSEMGGYVWWEFIFNELGDWTITFEFPGDHLHNPTSITRTITVQTEPIPYPVEDTPLPTDEAWTFPISVYNREWRNIAGPWYQRYYNASLGAWNPYTQAPKSAHILWKLDPVSGVGGFVGATMEDPGITTSAQYTTSAVSIETVMAGRGYYVAAGMIHCVDMFTGEELWSVPGNFHVGALRSRSPVLYELGTSFRVYDALTGAVTLDVPGMPVFGGWFTGYFYDDPYVISFSGDRLIKWTTAGTTANFAARVIWNISYPWMEYSNSDFMHALYNNLLMKRCQKWWVGPYGSAVVEALAAINMTTGGVEYFTEIIDYADPDTWVLQQGPHSGAGYGLFFFSVTNFPEHLDPPNYSGGFIALDAATGEIAWLSEPYEEYPWGDFHAYNPIACGNGMIYDIGYAGIHALNATNGKIVWYYSAGDAGMETPYNTWAFGSLGAIGGGDMLFAPNTEHSPTLYYRGEQLHGIDAFTGDKVWSIIGYYRPTAVAYGLLLASDLPNGFTYAFGKGTTATTVSLTKSQINKGEVVGITGTVMDMSPAQPGTPAVSKESMTDWMEYLHMQQSKPHDVTGVPVHLYAVHSDGTAIDIGTVTTNYNGIFSYAWTAPDEGAYTITAKFDTDESYYSSYAETTLAVGPEPTPPPEPPTEQMIADEVIGQLPAYNTMDLVLILAVVVAIVIGVVNLWALRKR